MSNIVNFPLLKQGMVFHSFREFKVLFDQLQKRFGLKYKTRSTKYLKANKQGKPHNPEIVYSEFHVQCNIRVPNLETGYVGYILFSYQPNL